VLFDALKARRNHPEYLSLFGNSLSELDDQFFVDIRGSSLLVAGGRNLPVSLARRLAANATGK
jgi:hypothetical protein